MKSFMSLSMRMQRGQAGRAAQNFFLDVCCGKGRLTAKMTLQGFDAAGIDCKYNKHIPICNVIDIDLSTCPGLQLPLRLCQEPRLAAVWVGIPCGTSSLAREVHIAWGSSAATYWALTLGSDGRGFGCAIAGFKS